MAPRPSPAGCACRSRWAIFWCSRPCAKAAGPPSRCRIAELIDAGIQLAAEEGIFVGPEGAACVAAAERLLREGFLKRDDKIVIYNTGSGLEVSGSVFDALPAHGRRRDGQTRRTDHAALIDRGDDRMTSEVSALSLRESPPVLRYHPTVIERK